MNDLLPKAPRAEGLVLTFFAVTITGYAMLSIYILVRLGTG